MGAKFKLPMVRLTSIELAFLVALGAACTLVILTEMYEGGGWGAVAVWARNSAVGAAAALAAVNAFFWLWKQVKSRSTL